ncbi:MAG: hypothetical protein U0790_14050 [Isosphaeraceae bacterium]
MDRQHIASTSSVTARPSWRRLGSRGLIVAFVAAMAAQLYSDFRRQAQVAEALGVVRKAGGMCARGGDEADGPVLSIDLDTFRTNDAHQVYRRGPVTDETLARLAPFRSLRELTLRDGEITDAGLAHLTLLKELRWLDLRRTAITDAGLAQLARCTNLDRLDLRGTKVTREGVETLRRALRGAEIRSDFPR